MKKHPGSHQMKIQNILAVIWLLIFILPACYAPKTVIPSPEGAYNPDRNILITPHEIGVTYEIIGKVELSQKGASQGKGLYEALGKECRKMGGDIVINVYTDQGLLDTTAVGKFQRDGSSLFQAPYAMPYGWVKGTVIRIKDPDKRKAYWDANERGDLTGACTIVGAPPPKK